MVSIDPGNREGPPGSLTEPKRDIVVIGASRGGVEALKGIVAALPPSLQSALLIVLHISPTHASLLPDVLSRAGPLPAEHGRDGTRIERGRIYVAPPDLFRSFVLMVGAGFGVEGRLMASDPST